VTPPHPEQAILRASRRDGGGKNRDVLPRIAVLALGGLLPT